MGEKGDEALVLIQRLFSILKHVIRLFTIFKHGVMCLHFVGYIQLGVFACFTLFSEIIGTHSEIILGTKDT